MKMRTVRKATLVGGIATGALLLAGSAAQAADTEVEEAGLDALQSAPDLLGGLPVPTDGVPGLDAVQNLPVVPNATGQSAEQPVQAVDAAESDADVLGLGDENETDDSSDSPLDLLGELGGGLPIPLPF